MKNRLALPSIWPVPGLSDAVPASGTRMFQQLVIFGDSLSDTGNRLTVDGVPQPPYHDGRWTNGPNWVDYFAALAGLPTPTAYLRFGGTNFAVGGATSEYAAGEIGSYLKLSGGRVLPGSLYVLWIGANDFRAGLTAEQSLGFIQRAIVSLAVAGARALVVITVPDISLTPEIRATGGESVTAAKQFAADVNGGLQRRLPSLGAGLGIRITLVDINPLFHRVVSNPELYGFSDSTGAAYDPQTQTESADPHSFVFWDGFHPTTHAHRLAAQAILDALKKENMLAPRTPSGVR